jgi:hypothetical protein
VIAYFFLDGEWEHLVDLTAAASDLFVAASHMRAEVVCSAGRIPRDSCNLFGGQDVSWGCARGARSRRRHPPRVSLEIDDPVTAPSEFADLNVGGHRDLPAGGQQTLPTHGHLVTQRAGTEGPMRIGGGARLITVRQVRATAARESNL